MIFPWLSKGLIRVTTACSSSNTDAGGETVAISHRKRRSRPRPRGSAGHRRPIRDIDVEHGPFMGVPSGKRRFPWRIPPMGKLTISTGPFSMALLNLWMNYLKQWRCSTSTLVCPGVCRYVLLAMSMCSSSVSSGVRRWTKIVSGVHRGTWVCLNFG